MKRMQIHIIAILFLMITFSAGAQQESQFIQVTNNPFIVNPAATGLTDVMQFELNSRMQWAGYNGGPRTLFAAGSSLISFDDDKVIAEYNVKDESLFAVPDQTIGKKHSIGGRASVESIGPFARTSVNGSYAIHLPFTNSINFGAGIGLGWSNFAIRQDRVVLFHEHDNSYDEFLSNSGSQNILDANAGLVFYNESFFLGVSSSHVLRNKVKLASIVTESMYNRHFYVVGRYKFELNDRFGLEPTVYLKLAENSPISGDLGARIWYNNSSWMGLQFRTSNAITFQIGTTLVKNLYAAYGYELTTGPLAGSGAGTHELQLGMYLGRNRNIDKEINNGPSVED